MRIISTLLVLAASTAPAQVQPEFKAPKEIAPGVFEVGGLKFDKNAKTVSIPAKVNMTDNLVEYLMVTPQGATHESVLVTDAQPQDLHMVMLLLGAKGMKAAKGAKTPERIDAAFLKDAPKLTGDNVTLTVAWKDKDGAEKTARLEKWIIRRVPVPKKPSKIVPVEEGPWLYTGSYFSEDNRFLAQVEGVFGSLVTYPSALINNPRKGANDDHMWFINKDTIPPKDTPVTLTIKLEAAAPADAPKDNQEKDTKKPAK